MTTSRRKIIKGLALTSGGLVLSPHILIGKSLKPFKISIRNAKVYHQDKIEALCVGITHDNQLKVSASNLEADTIIDAAGKIVSPGFIDILADNAATPQITYRIFEKYKLTDGATTVLQMHGGHEDPKWYYDYFNQQPHYVNHGIGVFVMRIRFQSESLEYRNKIVRQGMEQGALGISHSIEYQPDTTYEEVLGYAKIAYEYDVPLFLHLRYSSDEKELEGVKEAVKLSLETGAKVHIDHLHSTGGTHNMAEALEIIQNGINVGAKVSTCVYPYTYWATYLASERFSPGWQDRFGLTYEDLTVVGTGQKLNEQTFHANRKRWGLLVAVPPGTMPAEKTINLALQTDFCMIGSDGGIETEPKANNHPRGAGCFATAIRHGLNMGMSLPKVLSKVTKLPAQLMRSEGRNKAGFYSGMEKRGEILDGNIADLTIFDPKTINGKASVANPNQFSEGIDTIILDGEIVYKNQEILESKGKGIRYLQG